MKGRQAEGCRSLGAEANHGALFAKRLVLRHLRRFRMDGLRHGESAPLSAHCAVVNMNPSPVDPSLVSGSTEQPIANGHNTFRCKA